MFNRLYVKPKWPLGFGDSPSACCLHTAGKDSQASNWATIWPLAMVLKPHTSESSLCPAPAGRLGVRKKD